MKPPIVVSVLFAGATLAAGLRAQSNPRYTLWIDGPCGETIAGPTGGVWDDGTGGEPYFEGRPAGQTWDVVLTSAENDQWPGVDAWAVSLGIEGPLVIADWTSNGTAGCLVGAFPECRRGPISRLAGERTGPPDGGGPQTEENRGLVSAALLDVSDCVCHSLAREGSEKVVKLRVLAEFPETPGETRATRLVFAPRTGSCCLEPWTTGVGFSDDSGHLTVVTAAEGDPPLELIPCEVFLKATASAPFRRCDPDDDGRLTLPDAVWIFAELFRGGRATRCPAAADCNGDGARDLSDGIYGLRYLFTDAPPPPAPFPDCGFADLPEEQCPPGSTTCP